MRFTATRTFFRWDRVLTAPAKSSPICIGSFWTFTVPVFLSLVLLNCGHVTCTLSGSPKNTSAFKPTEGISSQPSMNPLRNSTQGFPAQHMLDRESVNFCQSVIDELRPEFPVDIDTELTAVVRQSEREYKEFHAIMARFDCRNKYSVRWNCSHCLVSLFVMFGFTTITHGHRFIWALFSCSALFGSVVHRVCRGFVCELVNY